MSYLKEMLDATGMMNRISSSYSTKGFTGTVQGLQGFKDNAVLEILKFNKFRFVVYILVVGLIGSGIGLAMTGHFYALMLNLIASVMIIWLEIGFRGSEIQGVRNLTSAYLSSIVHMEQFDQFVTRMVLEKKTSDPEVDEEKFKESLLKIRLDVTIDVTKKLFEAHNMKVDI